MKLGIKAKEIMRQDFPMLDSSLNLGNCVKERNKQEACIVLDKGSLHSILSYDDLLRAFFTRKIDTRLRDVRARQNLVIVEADTDVFDVIKLMMRERINFVIVRDGNDFGLITKEEIAEVNQFLFDMIEKEREMLVEPV